MSIKGFVLGVALLALVGWCMIHESVRQKQSRYRMAELAQRQDAIERTLEHLRVREDELRASHRLHALLRKHKLKLTQLGTAEPRGYAKDLVGARRPGQILDVSYVRAHHETETQMADAGGWQ